MNDTQSQTESLLEIVKGVDQKSIMLPEFQRDFRWELDRTYDLFDSLIRDIFIGTIIYGKPSFGMTLREIDKLPRKTKIKKNSPQPNHYSTDEIKKLAQTKNLRIVLDGQQRITSIYRALKGIDAVYIILQRDLDISTVAQEPLEKMIDEFSGEESSSAISIKLSDAFEAEISGLDDEELDARFSKSSFARNFLDKMDEIQRKGAAKIYRRGVKRLIDLYKQQKMVAFYLLDMSLDKFCLFFERSNSRGIQLNFTDILAAKLYHGFNLRKSIEDFESVSSYGLSREIIVRAVAYIVATEKGATVKIDREYILKELEAEDFKEHWGATCKLYNDSLQYLSNQNYILSQDWMPSENMIIPLMMFLRQIKGFDRMSQPQREFLEYWYWASIFSNRYSTSSNEVIITDCNVLLQVAKGETITTRGYFNRMRSLITEPEDLFSYNKKASAIYRGILNLLNYAAQGLKDWSSTHKVGTLMNLEDHHIYPKAYISSNPQLEGISQLEAEQLVDCVVNRTLIPKILNIKIGKRPPSNYLLELSKTNNQLEQCLVSHLLPSALVKDATWDTMFKLFLDERADQIFNLIEKYAIEKAQDMMKRYSIQSEITDPASRPTKPRLKDLINDGKISVGEKVYTRKDPTKFATIVDGDTVDFEGKKLPINTWGQQMTGWSSVNIYATIFLERTRQPLGDLR